MFKKQLQSQGKYRNPWRTKTVLLKIQNHFKYCKNL